MPRGDKTGPEGQGPMTGRRMGICAGFDTPGFTRGFGRGIGRGRGFGRGRGMRGWCWTPIQTQPVELSKEDQKKILESQKQNLENEIKAINKQLEEIQGE